VNLEQIISKSIEKINDFKDTALIAINFIAETVAHHPVATAVAYFATKASGLQLKLALALQDEKAIHAAINEIQNPANTIIEGFAIYLACKLAKEYVFDKRFNTKKEKKPIKQVILNNPTICALAGSVAATMALNTIDNAPVEVNVFRFLPNYLLLRSFLHIIGFQQEITKIRDETSDKNKKIEIADYLLARPAIPAAISGAAAFCYGLKQFSSGYNSALTHAFAVHTLLSVAAAQTAYFATQILSSALHSKSKDYAKLSLKAQWQKFCSKYDDALETLDKLEKIVSENQIVKIKLEKSEILACQGKNDDAMYLLKECVYYDQKAPANPLEFLQELIRITGLSAIKRAIQFMPFFDDGIKLSVLCLKDKRYFAAQYVLHSLMNSEPSLEKETAYLFFLDATKQQLKARKQLGQMISKYGKLDFTQMANSSDEVLECTSAGVQRTIVFKKSKFCLEKEYACTKLFYDSAIDKNSCVQPIARISINANDSTNYFAMSRIKGKTLFEIKNKEEYLFDAIVLLAQATQKADETYVKNKSKFCSQIDYFALFKHKFVDRSTKKEELKDKLCCGLFILEYLSCQEKNIIHGNPHSQNIIVSEKGKLCLIDFGDCSLADFGLDLEQAIQSINSLEERMQYYEKSILIRGQKGSKKELIKRYQYSSALKAMHLFGRSKQYGEDNVEEQYVNVLRAVTEVVKLEKSNNARKFFDAIQKLEAEI